MQLNSINSHMPSFTGLGDGWYGKDGTFDRKLNLRVFAADDYTSATIGETPSEMSLSDYLVTIVRQASALGRDRLLIHNRSGQPFQKQDFPFALSRALDALKIRRIAVVEPIDALREWTRLEIAFGRVFKVSVCRFPEAFDAIGWLCSK